MPPRESENTPTGGHLRAIAIVLITLLAPALGGSIQLWAQAILACAIGLLFLAAPPRRTIHPIIAICLTGLFLLALTAFLPDRWLPTPPWRIELTKLGAFLPWTSSPQPLLTLQWVCLLGISLAWAAALFSQRWEGRTRDMAVDIYCLGILILAAALTASYGLGRRVPFWPEVKEFGFFPNRNQTSNVLGLGGIVIYANAFRQLEHGNRRGWMWLAGLALICWALILNYSRAGIILFFGGAFIWHLCWVFRWRSDENSSRMIAWAPLAILVGLLVIAGGETLIRLKDSTDFLSATTSGRISIQRDALNFFSQSPMFGIGIGNFRGLFSAYHRYFVSGSEAIHPESDWLWMAVEMGIFAVVLVVVGLIAWTSRCFPLGPGTARGVRAAAMICVIGFAVHSLVDVSAHRIGSAWPALFLAAIAINPHKAGRVSRMMPRLFRGIGLVTLAIGGWWLSSIFTGVPASSETVERLKVNITAASQADEGAQLLELSNEGIRLAPLDWSFHYNRGLAEARLQYSQENVARDFAIARFLMPNWSDLYAKEGAVFLAADLPDDAFQIWREGMNRLSNPRELYLEVFGLVRDNAELRERWRQLGQSDNSYILAFLQNATPAEFQIELSRILQDDPNLHQFKPAELKTLFNAWFQRGEKLPLAEAMRAHPGWERVGWRELAQTYADYRDYRPAYETAVRHVAVDLPPLPPNETIESLVARFRDSGNTEDDGLLLARAQTENGRIDDALATIALISSRSNHSPQVDYIEAGLWAKKQEWQKAWQAMWKYLSTLPNGR